MYDNYDINDWIEPNRTTKSRTKDIRSLKQLVCNLDTVYILDLDGFRYMEFDTFDDAMKAIYIYHSVVYEFDDNPYMDDEFINDAWEKLRRDEIWFDENGYYTITSSKVSE